MIIGIDSLDPDLILKFKDTLPNLKRLIDESQTFRMKSVFPPDTIPAWITIYTGLNPAKHGIIHSFDVFESNWQNIANLNIDAFKGRTFWDIIGNVYNKKVCILFPQSAFPPWQVNGIMLSRSSFPTEELKKKGINAECVSAYPNSISEKYDISRLDTLSGHYPGFNKLEKYVENAKRKVYEQTKLGLEMLNNHQWDLFFIYFSELDIIQHFFWRYYDKDDPTHIDSPYNNVIKEFYELFDGIIGKFMEHQDVTKIIMSDHGHKMRPPKNININEHLRIKGYLSCGKQSYFIEKIKKEILDFVHDRDMTYWLVKIGKMKLFSGTSKKIYTSSSIIDTKNSLAYLSYFTGAKSYSEGGVHINRALVIEYEKFRNDLINYLYIIKDPKNGKNVFDWIKKREDVYEGKNIHIYPDIIFKLKDEYGVFWSVHTSIIGNAYEHNLSSGGHKEDAVLLISNTKKIVTKDNINLMDMAPTILDLNDIDWRLFDFDGKSIFKI